MRPDQIRAIREIEVPGILRRGRLFTAGLPGATDDGTLTRRLCFASEDAVVVVKTPESLEGHVTIGSPGAALEYVRVFSTPLTVRYLEQPWWLEVTADHELDPRFWLVSSGPVTKEYAERWSGHDGVLSVSDWERSGLRPPAIERQGADFIVTRPMVELTYYHTETHDVHEVREVVSPEGRVTRRILRTVDLPWVTLSIWTLSM